MINYFSISEFCITPHPIEQEVADKILQNFIVPLNPIRHQLGAPLIISKRSGFRPIAWEKAKGRTGESEHCFEGKGAADLVTQDMKALANLLAVQSPFMRICYYPKSGFVHCDYKEEAKKFYIDKEDGNGWKQVKVGMFLQHVR